MRRAISLPSHETRTSHSNTWCAVVPSATTMSHAHSTVIVGSGFVRLVPPDPGTKGGAGASQASDRELPSDWIGFRARVCAAWTGRESSTERRRGCCSAVGSPALRTCPRPSSPGRPGPAPHGQRFNAWRGRDWPLGRRGQPAHAGHWLRRTKEPPRRLLR